MVDDEPTRPDLPAQQAAEVPSWPLPQLQQTQSPHASLVRWLLIGAITLALAFGAGSGLTALMAAQANNNGSGPSTVPTSSPSLHSSPTLAPTSVPTVTAQPTEAAQPTPTSGGGD